jgi:hypothetical protein
VEEEELQQPIVEKLLEQVSTPRGVATTYEQGQWRRVSPRTL